MLPNERTGISQVIIYHIKKKKLTYLNKFYVIDELPPPMWLSCLRSSASSSPCLGVGGVKGNGSKWD